MFWKGFKDHVKTLLESISKMILSVSELVSKVFERTSSIDVNVRILENQVRDLKQSVNLLLDETDYKEPIGFLNSANYYADRVVTVKDGDGNVTHTGKCYGTGVTLNSIITDGNTTNTYRKHLIFENKLVYIDSSYSVEILQN